MSQIFIETVARAIGDYRFLLRRHLKQSSERQDKLNKLNLKDPTLFDNAKRLYDTAWDIVRDIEANTDQPSGYYAYSGIAEFGKFLKEYLAEYEVNGDVLVHSAQKASKEIIQAIQLMSLPTDKLNATVGEKLYHCNKTVAKYGTDDQQDIYESALEKQLIVRREYFMPIYEHFQLMLSQSGDGRSEHFPMQERAVG